MKTSAIYAIIAFGLGALAAPAPVVATVDAREASSGEYLGGIDVNSICRAQYGGNYYARANGQTCNDWKCTSGQDLLDMDTPRACAIQYGPFVYAYCSSGINGWGCYRS